MWAFGLVAFALLAAILVIISLVYSRSRKGRSGSSRKSQHYAVLSNQAAVASASSVLWAASSATSISPGVVLNTANGSLTLPFGTYLVQYSVRFNKTPFDGTTTATAQLQQTVAGVMTNIGQAAIVDNTAVDAVPGALTPVSQTVFTGQAIVTVNSITNNAISLFVTPGSDITVPAATGTDANAQLSVLQVASGCSPCSSPCSSACSSSS
jgi:hypothetical protein